MIATGKYSIYVSEEAIEFQINRKKYRISKAYLMNNSNAPIECIYELSKKGKIFPLKKLPGNRFALGKYSQFEIIINFNYVEIIKKERQFNI